MVKRALPSQPLPSNSGQRKAPQAKFSLPRQAKTVTRERLNALLDSFADQPVTWISGIPGAGKTSLVANYLAGAAEPVVWFHLGPEDSDPVVFFTQLRAAVTELREGPNIPVMNSDHLQELERFARRFLRELYACLGSKAILVLDDYHFIEPDLPLHQALASAVDEIPPACRLLILSRGEPPPEYSRLIANSSLSHCSDHDLRLTPNETAQLVEARQPASRRNVTQIHDLSQGWIAGVVLLLNNRSPDRELATVMADDSTLFHYFAQNAFNALDEKDREVLMQIAFLPYVDEALSDSLTGASRAKAILAAIHRRGLFVDQYGQYPVTYQLHPLFRLYLQEQAHQYFPEAEWRRIVQTTANLLCEHELYGDAIPLLGLLEQWEAVVELLLEQAPRMFHEGRRVALRTAILTLPEAVLDRHPWLIYWRSVCNPNLQDLSTKQGLELAMASFRKHADKFGMVMTATALIEFHAVVLGDYQGVAQWIELLHELFTEGVAFPTKDHEAAARAALFSAAVIHQPTRFDLVHWSEALLSFLNHELRNDTRLLVGRALLLYAPISGHTPLVRPTEVATIAAASDPAASPLNRIWYLARLAFACLTTKPKTEVHALFEQARELAMKYDITLLDSTVGLSSAWAADSYGDTEWFKCDFGRGQHLINPQFPLASAFLKHMETFACYMKGDLHGACEAGEYASLFFKAAGAKAGTAIVLQSLAFLYFKLGRTADALAAIRESEALSGTTPRFDYLAAWLLTAHDLTQGDTESAKTRLLSAIPMGAKFKLEIFLRPLTHPVVAEVCAFAMREDICVPLVQRIVAMHRMRPPTRTVRTWPWHIRIFTLGCFRVEVDGAPMAFNGRTPRKPLLLLKAICAAGGDDVPAHQLAEQLWPDADGDSARSTLEMTLLRLRRLLSRDFLSLDEGKLSLNHDLVWLDLWDFESTASDCLRALRAKPDTVHLQQLTDGLLSLYVGHLLPAETGEAWLFAARDRAMQLFLRVVFELGDAWEALDLWSKAAAFYERVVAIDIMVEELHRRLVHCYIESGQHGSALIAYRRLHCILNNFLGASPSPETTRLLQRINRIEKGPANGNPE